MEFIKMSGIAPQTRQKSCMPCAKAKKKCDQGNPVCFRCAEKFLLCEYKSENVKHQREAGRDGDSEMLMTYTQGLDGQHHISHNENIFPQVTVPTLDLNDLGMTVSSCIEPNQSVCDDTFFGAYDDLVFQSTYPQEIGTMDRERIRYCVRNLKAYPEKLFRFGKTPFIHPHAYLPTIPFPLQEACCAAALYSGKTDANEFMVWDIIMAKANHLMELRGESWSISEHLACLQALIIFQIIRLFDGDIRQRAGAELHEDSLAQWTDQLAFRTGATAVSEELVPSTFESWVFQESVCRTLIVSRMVQAMFSIQKNGFCTLVAAVTELSFTAQKALWHAPSGQHWQREIRDRSRYYCPRMDLEEILSNANVSDVDDLGMLMLVTYKGVDGVNDWITRTGNAGLIESR